MKVLPTRLIKLLLFFLFLNNTSNANTVDSLIQLSESSNLNDKANGLLELSKYYYSTDPKKSSDYYNQFLEIDIQSFEASEFRSLIASQAEFLKTSFKNQEAIEVLNDAIARARLLKDSSSLALMHQLITPHFYYTFNYDSCEYHLNEALKIYRGFKDTSKLGLLVIRKSGVQYAKGDYEKAIQYAFEATELFKIAKDEKQLGIAYLQLGNIFYFLKDHNEAKQYYQLSSTAFLSDNNEYGHFQALSNLSLVKTRLGEFRESIESQLKALKHFEENGYELEKGNSFRYLSLAYFGIKKYDSAAYFNDLAMASDQITKHTIGYSEGCLMKAKLLKIEKNYNDALTCANKAFFLADSISIIEVKKMVANELSIIHESLGNIDSSLKYLKIHLNLKDSLDLDPEKLKDYAMMHQFKIEEAEFNLALSRERELMHEEINRKRELQLITAIAVAIVSISLLFLAIIIILRNKKLTKELAEQQNRIKEELVIKESLLSEIHHRVKNNLQVISSMLSLQSQYINDAELKKVIDDCKNRITSMSLIHESLYQKIDVEQALFGSYVKNLIPRLIDTYQIDENKIKLKMDIKEVSLTLDESIPCGLIINEIVTNSLKHAFPEDKNGEIYISLVQEAGTITLNISDNGVGLNKETAFNQQNSFGFLLIDTLANQLEAKLTLDTSKGVNYQISWQSK